MSSDATADFDDYQPPDPRPTLPGYEVGAELGRGGMCIVYAARQLSTNRMVAVRVAFNPQLDAQLDNEMTLIARLRHPHIIQLYDVMQYGFPPRPCLIMELIPGGNLQQRLAGQPQDPQLAARLLAHIAATVHVMHEAGYLHLNLKPRKILLDRGPDSGPDNGVPLLTVADMGIPRLSGFELATQFDHLCTRMEGVILGTPAYMAPEQARGDWDAFGPATDIYALGSMLYEVLLGYPPFRANSTLERLRLIMESLPANPRRVRRDVDRRLDAICMKCLAKAPEDRFASAADLADALDEWRR